MKAISSKHDAGMQNGLADLALAVVNRQSVGTALFNHKQEIIFWNDWLAEWSGISPADAMGKSFGGVFPELIGSELIGAFNSALKDDLAVIWTQEVDPERLDMIESAMTRGDREMPLNRVAIVPTEIETEGRCVLLELEESPFSPFGVRRLEPEPVLNADVSRFPAFIESESMGVIVVDNFGFIQAVNNRMEKLCGYRQDQLYDKPLRILFPDLPFDTGDADGCREVLQFKMKQHPEGLMEAATIEGMTLQMEVSVFDAVHRRDMITLVCRDASRHAGTQEALFRQRELLSAVYGQVADAVLLVDRRGIIEHINPVGLEMLGLSGGRGRDAHIDDVLRLVTESGETLSPCVEAMSRETMVNPPPDTQLQVNGREPLQIMATATPLRNRENKITGAMLVLRAISESRRISTQLNWQSNHDPLTQLPNRRQLENEILTAIDAAHLRDTTQTLLYIDLYNFSVVNDTCGPAAGDELLRQFARLLMREVDKDDFVARIGNDEFAVLLWNRSVEESRQKAESLLWQIKDYSFPWGERRLKIGASIGAKVIDQDTTSEIDVLISAGASAAAAKEAGRNRIHFHYKNQEISHRHNIAQWISRISEALEEDRFTIYCQPIIPLNSGGGREKHYEALVRMIDPEGRLVPPGAFIPAAEHFGLIDDIDRWVVEKIFTSLQELGDKRKQSLRFAINLSGNTIGDDQFRTYLMERFAETGVDPRQIQFEVTETSAIRHFDRAVELIRSLKAMGCYFSLDDFGSGLSSFGYLKELPVDFLKIDGSFIRNMELSEVDYSMVSTINHLGHIMGIATIAENVETPTQLSMLEEIGVDYAQGFGIASPVPLETLFQ